MIDSAVGPLIVGTGALHRPAVGPDRGTFPVGAPARGEGYFPCMDLSVRAPTLEWRGPPPYLFARMPEEAADAIAAIAREASYGWGCIPVTARIGDTEFTTALSSAPEVLDVPGLPPVNNDHVLAPDGSAVYASGNDFHVWEVPLGSAPDGGAAAGAPRRITPEDGGLHFLHGVSPDGTTLAYVHLRLEGEDWWAAATIRLIGVDGTGDRAVTTHPGPADGSEFTPDGEWILLNTEQFSEVPGHAQIARVRPDGTELAQLTRDERVNWFPHPSPDGQVTVYLSFPPGTTGHPADLEVELRLVEGEAWDAPRTLVTLFGGQGTLNVPGWATDGSAFAFVDYPLDG